MADAKIYIVTFTNTIGKHEEYVSSENEQNVIDWCEKEAAAYGCEYDWELFLEWDKTIKVRILDGGVCNA